MAGTVPGPGAGEKRTTGDKKAREHMEAVNNLLNASNKIPGTSLDAAAEILNAQLKGEITNAKLAGSITTEKLSQAKLVWYTPKIIGTEESRTNVAFGTLTTADEITNVVLPENGLIVIGYKANFKSSVSGAGRAAIFLGANQLKASNTAGSGAPVVVEIATESTIFRLLTSSTGTGLVSASPETTDVTTGMLLGGGMPSNTSNGLAFVYAAAGTYAVSIQFKASSGSITAKERKLWVATLG